MHLIKKTKSLCISVFTHPIHLFLIHENTLLSAKGSEEDKTIVSDKSVGAKKKATPREANYI